MKVFAIGDLHLSFGIKGKEMDVFGAKWKNHPDKIKKNWEKKISPDDLVLLPGDFSWALKLDEAKPDFDFLHSLPGTKVMIKGNHDYWWGSIKKVKEHLPPSIFVIQNDSFNFHGVSICGARLWDTPEYSFDTVIDFKENPLSAPKVTDLEKEEKIFLRELVRLELSLKQIDSTAKLKIAMTHYPPIGLNLLPSRTSKLLEKFGIQICIFGHLHSLKDTFIFNGKTPSVHYFLTACDYLDFNPLLLAEI